MMTPEQLKRHKTALWLMVIAMFTFGVYCVFQLLIEGFSIIVFVVPLFLILTIQFYREIIRTKSLSYDQDALYYSSSHKAESIKVPLENVRSITVGNKSTSETFSAQRLTCANSGM